MNLTWQRGRDEMDKQTAIDLLDNLLGMVEDNHESDYDTAIKMGIDALKEKMQLSKEDATFPVDGEPLDCISRQQAILCIERNAYRREDINETERIIQWVLDIIKWLPSAQPTLYGYPIELLSYIARVMEKEGVTAEYAVRTFDDMSRAVRMIIEEAQQKAEEMLNERFNQPKGGD